MNEIVEILGSNIIPILATALTGILSYIGMQIKNMIQNNLSQKEKETIVSSTVNYVEQISKDTDMTSSEKFAEVKEKASSWLRERNIKFSDTELDIMIECAVKNLTITS